MNDKHAATESKPFQIPEHTIAHEIAGKVWDEVVKLANRIPEAKAVSNSAGLGKPAADELNKVDKVAGVSAEQQQKALDEARHVNIYGGSH